MRRCSASTATSSASTSSPWTRAVRFLDRLAGVTEPERKRRIIGEEFIRVFE